MRRATSRSWMNPPTPKLRRSSSIIFSIAIGTASKKASAPHLLIVPVDGGPSRDLTPGDHDAPPFSLGGQDDYAFSPDGQEICYTSNHDEEESTSTNNDLWIVPVNGSQPAEEHHCRQQSQRLHAAVFTRRKIHRLPRAAEAGIRERSLPADAVRQEDREEEKSDPGLSSINGSVVSPGPLDKAKCTSPPKKKARRRRGQSVLRDFGGMKAS